MKCRTTTAICMWPSRPPMFMVSSNLRLTTNVLDTHLFPARLRSFHRYYPSFLFDYQRVFDRLLCDLYCTRNTSGLSQQPTHTTPARSAWCSASSSSASCSSTTAHSNLLPILFNWFGHIFLWTYTQDTILVTTRNHAHESAKGLLECNHDVVRKWSWACWYCSSTTAGAFEWDTRPWRRCSTSQCCVQKGEAYMMELYAKHNGGDYNLSKFQWSWIHIIEIMMGNINVSIMMTIMQACQTWALQQSGALHSASSDEAVCPQCTTKLTVRLETIHVIVTVLLKVQLMVVLV